MMLPPLQSEDMSVFIHVYVSPTSYSSVIFSLLSCHTYPSIATAWEPQNLYERVTFIHCLALDDTSLEKEKSLE